ncbi:MAG: hypothetical protein DME05_14415 [Candidatus Rokuibacteriota bacterium]|nr:MAG: hypothetical protein DME05_14415 [Candidatus Rokubacteria bacterium]
MNTAHLRSRADLILFAGRVITLDGAAHVAEAVVRSAALQMDMSVIAFKAVLRALEPAVPAEKRLTAREVEFAEQTLRAQQDALTRAALVRALYTYRTLSDEELATYVEFSESDAGRRRAGSRPGPRRSRRASR